MLWLFDVTKEIKLVTGEVKRIQDQHMQYIDVLKDETSSSPDLLQADVQTMEEVVVGFEHKVKDIVDRLKHGSKELEIISIIGMPGMGKTTLAKKVYHDPSVKYHFTKFVWCTVSQSYSSKKLMIDILDDVTRVDDSFSKLEEEELADKLRKCLKGQKYLIVMDDIWDVSAWDALKLSFPDDNNASRIIFTTRIHNVVLEAKSDSCPYPLSPLSNEESWELLEKKLFHKDSCPPNFVEVGKQIAKNCEGLPLAVVLVAGLLKEKIENLNWWKQIGESLGSRISKEGCAKILELSYKHLPLHLKPCFLYFGSFQEDKVIRVRKLTQLWVSEGFIQKQEMKNLENVAKEYLFDLVGRSLVIVVDKSSTGGIKSCRIHDLLREFCLGKGETENFFMLVQENDSQYPRDALYKHYRVCIQTQHWRSFLFWNSSALHSLLFSPPIASFSFDMNYCHLSSSKFLQVLDLEDVPRWVLFPEEVTALVLLRYLAIYLHFEAPIPRSIMRLQNLETFRANNVHSVPSTLWKMLKLRHVDVGKFSHLHVDDYIPPLENIQSFSFPSFTDGEKVERFLRKIPTVRKLGFQVGQFKWGKQILKLDFLSCLESLNVIYAGKKLNGSPLSLPSSLKKLTLKGFSLPWAEISMIAKLPNLEVLKLLEHAFGEKTWNMEEEEFLKLKFLKLELLDIKQWNASNETLPCLEHLVVEHCHKLKKIPSAFANIPTLRMIQIRWCNSTAARSTLQIQEEQLDLGNELEVLISETEETDSSDELYTQDLFESDNEMDTSVRGRSFRWLYSLEMAGSSDEMESSEEEDYSDELYSLEMADSSDEMESLEENDSSDESDHSDAG